MFKILSFSASGGSSRNYSTHSYLALHTTQLTLNTLEARTTILYTHKLSYFFFFQFRPLPPAALLSTFNLISPLNIFYCIFFFLLYSLLLSLFFFYYYYMPFFVLYPRQAFSNLNSCIFR